MDPDLLTPGSPPSSQVVDKWVARGLDFIGLSRHPQAALVRVGPLFAAPSAPRSGPPAATLSGGLRPGSLRVHDPCKQEGHGSRLGFPGRRRPRVPAAPGNVARDLQVLPRQAEFGRARGAGPGPGGTWFAGGRGPAAEAERRWGWPSCCPTIRSARKDEVAPDRPMELFRRERPTPRALPD